MEVGDHAFFPELPNDVGKIIIRKADETRLRNFLLVSKYWSKNIFTAIKSLHAYKYNDIPKNIIFTNVTWVHLGKMMPNVTHKLKHLYTGSNVDLSDGDIVGKTRLRTLDVRGWCSITNAGIIGLTNLTYLAPCKYITNFSTLINLTILSIPHFEHELSYLSLFTRLTSLTAYSSNICDKDIVGLTNLTYLDVSDTVISYNGIKYMKKLKELDISDTNVVCVRGLKSLTSLNVCSDALTNLGGYLIKLTGLTALNLDYDASINAWDIDRLTQLQCLYLSHNNNITDAAISGLTNLTEISVYKNYNISAYRLLQLQEKIKEIHGGDLTITIDC